jgi:hypothetical protein
MASRNIGNKPDEALRQGQLEAVTPASGELFGGCSKRRDGGDVSHNAEF